MRIGERTSYHKDWYEQNKDKVLTKSQKYYSENKKKVKERHYLRFVENPDAYLHAIAKSRAKRKNLSFDLEVSDVVVPEYCPYLGMRLTRTWGQGFVDSNPSIDRIDNSKGYIKGNVEVISYKANRMKVDASIEELVTFAKGVLNRHT